MREHEVPTHVQAEDKVLLWFTFPQIVAITAVGALAYGAYRYAPVGPSEARMALAVLIGLLGIAMTVGKVGGRRLPLAAADLLRFRLGPRRYAGPPAELARSEPPAPAVREPGPLTLMARRVRRGLRGLRKKKRSGRERHNGRMPLRARDWLRKRRQHRDSGNGNGGSHQAAMREPERPRSWRAVLAASSLAVAVLAVAVVAAPRTALADGHWRDEIDFEVTEPIPGRRVFVEGLTVSGGQAEVSLRAATALDLRVRAYGGPEGRDLRFWGAASLVEGERTSYFLPLSGEAPSLTFSWEDSLGQAGAVAFKDGQLPHPLPSAEGGALQPPRHVPGLESGEDRGSPNVGLRVHNRGGRQSPDGGGPRERHGDSADGGRRHRHHRGRHGHCGRIARQRPVRPRRRDPLLRLRRGRGGRPRCGHRGRRRGGPPGPRAAARGTDPPPGPGRTDHQDRAPPPPGGQRRRQ